MPNGTGLLLYNTDPGENRGIPPAGEMEPAILRSGFSRCGQGHQE